MSFQSKRIVCFKKIRNFVFTIFQFCVYFLGIVLLVILYLKVKESISEGVWLPKVDTLADWAQVVIAYAAIFAIGQYALSYSEVIDKKTRVVLELIKFYRESVILSVIKIDPYLKSKKKQLPILNLNKNTPVLKFTEKEYFKKILPNQRLLVESYMNIIGGDYDLESIFSTTLNSIEEFAMGVLNSDSQKHTAFSAVEKSFVEIIEYLAVPLYFHIGVLDYKFAYISELYDLWREKTGFVPITPGDKMKMYEERLKKHTNQN